MYTIAYDYEGETFYLNHSCLSSCSFGSEDMAWATDDREKADLMLDRVNTRNPEEGAEAEVREF